MIPIKVLSSFVIKEGGASSFEQDITVGGGKQRNAQPAQTDGISHSDSHPDLKLSFFEEVYSEVGETPGQLAD